MANKKVKGITIEIDGNTTELDKALKSMNDIIYKSNSELKELKHALKLDPKNVTLLNQKQELLKSSVSATKDKLNEMKKLQKEMGSYDKLTDKQKESYRRLNVEIAKTSVELKDLEKTSKKLNNVKLDGMINALKKVGSIATGVLKTTTAIVSGISSASIAAVTAGVNSFASLEQNLGGVDTLFGDNADKVKENASKAFETAGLSANEYMKQVTSFSASLLQSLSGDTSKAADVADMALIDMADNANKFGTDMQSIQNAYQGFAKQNYTMLDNLKLGYGGTKSEMERLLSDASKLTGVKYDISNLSDVYNAIHAIQKEMGVTGTTSIETSTTISGSVSAMKSALDNFLNGTGSPEQLSKSIETMAGNISNVVANLAPQILNGLVDLMNILLPQIGQLLLTYLPMLFDTAQSLINGLLQLIVNNVDPISAMVAELFTNLSLFIIDNLPLIVEGALNIVIALANGIIENLDQIIPAVIECIVKIAETLLTNIDLLIETALKLVIGLASGFIQAIPTLVSVIPRLTKAILDGLLAGLVAIANIGKYIVEGIWSGIKGSFDWLKKKLKEWIGNVTKFIKKIFGINSPSKVMKDQVGKNLGYGVAEGINATVSDVQKAMTGLSAKVEASVNPTINPSANSNPLIIQIDKFVNDREQSVEALATELEFYRKNRALATGGN